MSFAMSLTIGSRVSFLTDPALLYANGQAYARLAPDRRGLRARADQA
jgi:hypothetical protein